MMNKIADGNADQSKMRTIDNVHAVLLTMEMISLFIVFRHHLVHIDNLKIEHSI